MPDGVAPTAPTQYGDLRLLQTWNGEEPTVSDPNSPQYGGPPAPEYGGQPQYGGVPQQPQYGGAPQPPQYGGPPPAPYGGELPAATPPPKKSGGAKKVVFSILGVIVALVVALGVRAAIGGGLDSIFGDKTSEAKAGDCLGNLDAPAEGETTDANNAEVVDCNSADAKYNVVGRVDGKTFEEFDADGDMKICGDAGVTAEAQFWSGEQGRAGYVLCLTERA